MKKSVLISLVGMAGVLAASCADVKNATAADGLVIWDDRPGGDWQSTWYPLGNGRLGCMVDGGTGKLRVQFNVDSLWTGDENISSAVSDGEANANYKKMGAYQNFGELEIEMDGLPKGDVKDYRRELDISDAVYSDSFRIGGVQAKRRIFASAPDDCIVIAIDAPCARQARLSLKGAHGEPAERTDGESVSPLSFSGRLPNGLEYAARADVSRAGGRTVVVLRAKTGGRQLDAPSAIDADIALERHVADYRKIFGRMRLGLGAGDKTVPTRLRLARVKKGAEDPSLVALQFAFGRYLLISCSRPGTLPANLQGLWNNSNSPAWHSDYHTDINIQMNYWGADSANLFECFTPFSDWMVNTLSVAEKGTRAAFPGSKGYAYRMSANAVGGGGWRWNFAGAPWMAAQCYDHWLFTRDDKYLRDVCWPVMKGAAEFVIATQLKERPDGTVVVKNGWSPEHGPREDGVAHDQQIMRELFRSIIAAAKTLGIDDAFTREVARLEPKLLKDKIGSWGQLQEWETDRDKKGDKHRHTSHLYAVYPGSTISRKATPELAQAAKVALAGRATTGDSRRSWTWPWRAALWARLGEGPKAGAMLDSLLRYNTLDNMFATHPPFQIDGNLGMVGAVCETLVQSHETDGDGKVVIRILPAIPPSWREGFARGIRARGGYTVDLSWKCGKLESWKVLPAVDKPAPYVLKLPDAKSGAAQAGNL